MKPIVAYLRVSTGKQAKSGLGVEAQREAVRRFADAEGYSIVDERVEVETGKGADALDRRPELASALEHARKRKCPIVVAKLDRLSRDVALVLPHILPLHEQGLSLRAIARELTTRGVPTARGGQWYAVQVADILRRRETAGVMVAG